MESTSIVLEKQRRSYDKVSLPKRKALVEMVMDGNTIAYACKQIGIKYSTAKLIVKRYKETRTFYESRQMRHDRAARDSRDSENQEEYHGRSQSCLNVVRPQPIAVRPHNHGFPAPLVPFGMYSHLFMTSMMTSCHYGPAWLPPRL